MPQIWFIFRLLSVLRLASIAHVCESECYQSINQSKIVTSFISKLELGFKTRYVWFPSLNIHLSKSLIICYHLCLQMWSMPFLASVRLIRLKVGSTL